MAEVDFASARAPEGMRLYAIGDVHGRRDLLVRMHEAIDAEIARDRPGDWRIVHLGDYCDRGPDTKGVLDFIIARQAEDARILSLRGNHDDGMLNFLKASGEWRIFTNNGGETTASSYGVQADFSTPWTLEASRDALNAAMPAAHRAFLEALPYQADFGDFMFCHAGVRPGVPLDGQYPQDLIWIRDAFLHHDGLYARVIVHGHTPVDGVDIRRNRVNLDTRAFASGRLSAIAIEGDGKRILEAGV